MKKLICIGIMVLMVLAVALPNANVATASGTATITFAFWDKAQQDGMAALASAFMGKYRNVSIELQITPKAGYWTKLETATMSGQMPDVFWMDADHVVNYVSVGALMGLDDAGVNYAAYPEALTGQYTYGGVHYAIPKDYETVALAYNKEIFDVAKMPYPDETWNWYKLYEVAMAMTDPVKEIYGFGAPNDSVYGYYNAIYQNGGFVLKDGAVGYNLPEAKEAVRYWTEFVTVDGVSPNLASFEEIGCFEQFMEGKLAMMFVGSGQVDELLANEKIKDKVDFASLPMGTKRASMMSGIGYAGAATTAQPEAVKRFLAVCGSEEGNVLQAKAKAAIPAYKGTEKYYLEQFGKLNMKSFTDALADAVLVPFSVNKDEWMKTETQTMGEIYSGKASIEEGLNFIHDTITKLERDPT